LAPETRLLEREWLRACDAFLSATLAHTRYLRATGRMADPESAKDVALLELQYRDIRARRERLPAEREPSIVQLPQDPGMRLSMAARRELGSYRDAVCEDSRRLRATSAALVRRSRQARRLRVAGG
jgi:hypothetical protein